MEDNNTYEIFKKGLDNTTELIETVKGIGEAQKALQQLRQGNSGEFFILDSIDGKVIDPFHPAIAQDPFAL